MAISLKTLLVEADSAHARGNTQNTLSVVIRILHQLADGTAIIGDGSGLTDDIEALEAKAGALTVAGDDVGALKAQRQANMLKSAQSIDDATSTDEEK